MTTISLVDPAARTMAAAFAAFDPTSQSIEEYRSSLGAAMSLAGTGDRTNLEERWVPGSGDQPDVRVLLYRPNGGMADAPAILFIHASGYIAGKPDWMAEANQALANAQGAIVVAVNYRLAPETAFPGPLEDCYVALRWLIENSAELGVDRARIVVMGESAGGGLAAALALLVRDRQGITLAGQVLVYPMLDPRTGTSQAPVENPTTGEFVWTRGHNRFGWNAMRGAAEIPAERLVYFAPALASDLSGLPPAFLAVGALDLFVDETADYALRLGRAAVSVEFHLYPGGIHGFDLTSSRIAGQYKAVLAAALEQMLACQTVA
ncbi:alpha/beta hydrolase [Sphingobium sp. H39-3-25]|uniref:alpha/beta hydrolase n=1 Tax=Sphingobium arseniciresistens TaxID=3030834 RepID=UPI0023B8BEC4|nr:alpha/beta hydrolase [Sphingobium arseniciresistens]